ncbi:MAG: hypothetical protein U0414_16660 [Polyangiaceae bacterium]
MKGHERLAVLALAAWAIGCSADAAQDAAVPTADIALTTPPTATARRPPVKKCEPGETEPCACPNEATGVRTCSADGTRMRACNCEPPKPPSATGVDECDRVLDHFAKLADDIEACSKGSPAMADAAASVRKSRESLLETFVRQTRIRAPRRP